VWLPPHEPTAIRHVRGMFEPRSVLEAEGYRAFNLGADVIGLETIFGQGRRFGPS